MRSGANARRPRPPRSTTLRVALFLAGIGIGAHLLSLAVSAYEFHRDEFLYLAMGDHLRLWGMDFPPFIAIAGNVERFLFGDHLWAVRLLPAVAGALLVALAVDVAGRLGGGRFAQVAAGASILVAPLFLRASALFQPVVFDQLWWTLALWALLRRGFDDDPRWWLAVGTALGVGLLTKFSIAFIAIPLATATLVTGLRRDLGTRWPWIALGLTLLIGHPSIAGQIALGWPFFTQMADLRAIQLERVTWGAFLGEQLLLVGPAALLAAAGAVRLVAQPGNSAERATGLAATGAFVFLLLLHGKAYYVGPVYPLLVAGGAAWLGGRASGRRVARASLGVLAAAQVAFGVVALPMGLPILPPAPMAAYAARLGVAEATRTNTGEQLDLPQDYADMLGWSAFADTVARVFHDLPDAERRNASLLANNYGQAGALEWYGRRLGLPPPVSPVGSYWFWGPGDRGWEVAVIAGADSAGLAPYFRDIRRAARIVDERRVPEERDVSVWVVRDPVEPIAEVWPRFRGRN